MTTTLERLESQREAAAAVVTRLESEVKAAQSAAAAAVAALADCTDEAEAMRLLVRQTTQKNVATALGRDQAAARQAQATAERAYTEERQRLVDALISRHTVTLQADCLALWQTTLTTRNNLLVEFNAAGLRPPWGHPVAPELAALDKVLSGLETALKGLGASVLWDSSQKLRIALGDIQLERYPLGVTPPVINHELAAARRKREDWDLLSGLERTIARRLAAGLPMLAQHADD